MDFAKLLPLAFVMIAGPQILTAIFLATTEKWRANSMALVAGAAISITAVATIAYVLGAGASNQGASNTTLNVIILVLLLAAALHTFLTRKTSKPPTWMGKPEGAEPSGSFKLGLLLLGIFPTDILTSIAVGGYAASHNESWRHILPFVLLTLLFLALPSLLIVLLGKRAEAFLPKVRDWMKSNSWIISEIVLALFIVLTVNSLAA